jgi:hypothetical protein
MYAICDIALDLILEKSSHFERKDCYPSDPRILPMYFRRHDDELMILSIKIRKWFENWKAVKILM